MNSSQTTTETIKMKTKLSKSEISARLKRIQALARTNPDVDWLYRKTVILAKAPR